MDSTMHYWANEVSEWAHIGIIAESRKLVIEMWYLTFIFKNANVEFQERWIGFW